MDKLTMALNARRLAGFTLIEVMIVVVIIGILASIAYPSYDEYVKRGNRTEGQVFLSDAAARQERYYSQNNSYTADPANLGVRATSETGKYTLTIEQAEKNTDGGYSLIATPSFIDAKCGDLTLNALGVRGASEGTAADCWR